TAAVRATLAARDIPYGALAHLLPAEIPASVANPLRWAVDRALSSARGRGLALLVDDAHQLDPASAAVVHHLVQHRLATVVGTVRAAEPAPDVVSALWTENLATRLELAPLG